MPIDYAVKHEHRAHALHTGRRYFGSRSDAVAALPCSCSDQRAFGELVMVPLPTWAADLGVGSIPALAVDKSCLSQGREPEFERCDWLKAAFLHLDGWLERSIEREKGPIHSYALRLPKEAQQAYDRAWVNRIYLFLRRWAASHLGQLEEELFGPRPPARFILTHDVDALEKTMPLRLKSSVMSTIATARHALAGRLEMATQRAKTALRYALTSSDYWLFDEVCCMEASRGFRSVFLFADGDSGGDAVKWLLDPSYRVADPRVGALMRKLSKGGWQIGIHPGFKSWDDAEAISTLIRKVEEASGQKINLCRQHWLRFSWEKTWLAQQQAGVAIDFTLGFNDRLGFRNGAAVAMRPWNWDTNVPMALTSLPTILMDSQFYDYDFPADIKGAMIHWIDEVMAVGGEATLLWHIHTMHPEYGWANGYEALLDLLVERRAVVTGASVD